MSGQDQSGYQSASQAESGMGGGEGVHGSGVAGGYTGNQQQQQQNQPGQEKQDWLDKGVSSIGQKFGVNVSQQNADKIGDFANKEAKERAGRGLPGVQ